MGAVQTEDNGQKHCGGAGREQQAAGHARGRAESLASDATNGF